jgi:hypothetical protein
MVLLLGNIYKTKLLMGEQELKVLENKLLRRISGPKKYGQ